MKIFKIFTSGVGLVNGAAASVGGEALFSTVGDATVEKIFDKVDEISPRYRKKGFSIYLDKRNGNSLKLKGAAKKAAKARIKLTK